ncbi:MAG: PIG-L family deacetylase, partial [Daejeonella sp.]
MNIRYLPAALFISLSLSLNAQTAHQLNAAEIKLGLQKLNIVGTVLYIAAHPDDENTRLLSYLAKERKVRTGYLSLTRGDGGQNLIGNEQGELLGLIRTQELLAARRIDGAEQFFTRANDFGFSKTSDETFNIWGKEQILADVVWVIRKFKPDVIIARFPEDTRAGHGHHAASAIIAREAFVAAADPERFPEQLKQVQTWQAKRMVWNTYNFGGNNTTSNDQLKLDVGLYNPLLGKGYGEIAAESRSNHKSQGFGSASQRGQTFEYFKPVAGDAAQTDLFDGINMQWNRLAGGEKVAGLISQANESFNIEEPSKSVAALVSILTELEKLKDTYWKEQKEKEIKELIAAAAGLWFESYAAVPSYAIGDSVKIRSELILRSAAPITLESVSGLPQNTSLNKNILKTVESSMPATSISEPYWLAEDHPEGFYTIKDQNLVGNPENPDPLKVSFK